MNRDGLEAQERRDVVAGLRELADLLESSPWLPVPFYSGLQAGVALGLDQAERFAALRQVADLLGVDVVETANGARSAELELSGGVTYFVHVNADDTRTATGTRVVPASEDEQPATASAGVAR